MKSGKALGMNGIAVETLKYGEDIWRTGRYRV